MILDTNALSAWLDGDPAIGKVLAQASQLLLSPIVLGEYRFGIQSSRHHREYQERLALIEEDLPTLPLDAITSEHYALVRQELKSKGNPIPRHDVWIAAQAREHSLPIVSRDAHFDLVPGISRIGW
jgi:predicted nucleic acid-binding protein